MLLVFDEDIGAALGKACEQDSDSDAVHLAHAAQIVRQHVEDSKPFNGSFAEKCQEVCAKPNACTSKCGAGRPKHQEPNFVNLQHQQQFPLPNF